MIFKCRKCGIEKDLITRKTIETCPDCWGDMDPNNTDDMNGFEEFWCEKCEDVKKVNIKISKGKLFENCPDCNESMVVLDVCVRGLKEEYKVTNQVLSSRKVLRPDFDHMMDQEGLDLSKDISEYKGQRKRYH